MQVTETNSEGLARQLKIVVEAAQLNERLVERLEGLKGQVRLNGFRPGKVPVSHLRKVYGKSVMAEIVQETVGKTMQEALAERELRPAENPHVDLAGSMDDVVDGKADLEFTLDFEIVPQIDFTDFSKIKVEKPVVTVEDSEIQEALERIAGEQRSFEAKEADAKAETGDVVMIDFVGRKDGVEFEGGKGEDVGVEIGAGRFIPGFEEHLIGLKAGDDKSFDISFPEDYQVDDLKGQVVEFSVDVKEVRGPKEAGIDDELAKRMGLDKLDTLKTVVSEQLGNQYQSVSRDRVREQLMDALNESHGFELPSKMVAHEFEHLWDQLKADLERRGESLEESERPEDEMREEYQDLAQRRVRLGLLLGEIGRVNDIDVTEEELNQALGQQMQQVPPQHQEQVLANFRQNAQAQASMRAPIYEDKVVDFLLELAEVKENQVTRDELLSPPEAEDEKPAKPKKAAKKPAKKSASTKKSASKSEAGAAKKPAAKKAAAKPPSDKADKADKADKSKPKAAKSATKKADDK